MLFYGPPETGKGTAALELARVLSCGADASWKCSCPSCERHRYLQHDDLLILGSRSFQAELGACRSVFLSNPSVISAKLLFFRSLRKLQMRFSPVLLENDPAAGKLSSTLRSLDEGLNEFLLIKTDTEKTAVESLCNSLIKSAITLCDEGLKDRIPINHIRNAAYWCRLAPNGKRKTLIIENAENMRDDGRNSLLKLLEEPPDTVSIILTAQRREAIMATILSRLRPYRFLKRSEESEKEVLRRIFQYSSEEKNDAFTSVSGFLGSFLPQNREKTREIAAWFIVSFARITIMSLKKKRKNNIPVFLNILGERYAQAAETSGMARVFKITEIVKMLTVKCGNFDGDSFNGFFRICMDLISEAAAETNGIEWISFKESFRKRTGEAVMAVDVLNQSPALALESFLFNLRAEITRG
jgi:DNA polymerase-3 subunit gamma/tau